MVLPTEVSKGEPKMPAKLVFVGHQGCGKTSLLAALPNCLLIDLEEGSSTFSGMKLNIKKIANEENKGEGEVLMEVLEAIKEANSKQGGFVYDFIAFDTLTALEVLAVKKATINFQRSVIGQGMIRKGAAITDVVADLADGAGYRWLYNAFTNLYDQCLGLSKYGVIFTGHTKQGALLKNGQKIEARDMALTGKLKLDLLRDVDAAGYIYMSGENNVTVTFKMNEQDLTTKSRCSHLRNQEFVISTYNPDKKEFTFNWNKIYPTLIDKPIIIKEV